MCPKSTSTEAVSNKVEKKNQLNVNVPQNSLLITQPIYSSDFCIGRITTETPAYMV